MSEAEDKKKPGNYEALEKGLMPLAEDPLGDWEDWEKALAEYGFGHSYGERFGDEYGTNIVIHGPSTGAHEFMVEVTVNDSCYLVWCADYASFQGYLVSIAPLVAALETSRISRTLAEASNWLFSETDGLFRDHVRQVQHEHAEKRRFYKQQEEERKRQEAKQK